MRPHACHLLSACALLVLLHPAAPSSATPRLAVAPGVETLDLGSLSPDEEVRLGFALALRDREGLEATLRSATDPASASFGHWPSPAEAEARFAPTLAKEAAVTEWLRASGFTSFTTLPHRLLVVAEGPARAAEAALGVDARKVLRGDRVGYVLGGEPRPPDAIAPLLAGVLGTEDLVTMRPAGLAAAAAIGSDCCAFSPVDLRHLYHAPQDGEGKGRTVVIVGAYAWSDADLAAFNAEWGLPPLPEGSGQVCTGTTRATTCVHLAEGGLEASLDVQQAHGSALAARILNYMAGSTLTLDFTIAYARAAVEHPGAVVTTSWSVCEQSASPALQRANDAIFAYGSVLGQSWFAASGDAGASCGLLPGPEHPANSPHVVGVGGTRPTCVRGMVPEEPACVGYGAEEAWPSSGGGRSLLFPRPPWQQGCGIAPGVERLVPDVALAADPSPGVHVRHAGGWWTVGGTSAGAPWWAARMAALGVPLGHAAPRLYALCGTPALHDVVHGADGRRAAAPGHDLLTGVGTPDAESLLRAYMAIARDPA